MAAGPNVRKQLTHRSGEGRGGPLASPSLRVDFVPPSARGAKVALACSAKLLRPGAPQRHQEQRYSVVSKACDGPDWAVARFFVWRRRMRRRKGAGKHAKEPHPGSHLRNPHVRHHGLRNGGLQRRMEDGHPHHARRLLQHDERGVLGRAARGSLHVDLRVPVLQPLGHARRSRPGREDRGPPSATAPLCRAPSARAAPCSSCAPR